MRVPGLALELAILTGVGTLLAPKTTLAKGNVNIYRYDETPTHVLLGATPNTLLASTTSGAISPGVSMDVAPYFLFGGGIRNIDKYRSNSVAGRLTRVLTKTSLSAAVLPDSTAPSSWRVGFGIRTTFHDPHDPVLNSSLPERVAEELARHGVDPPADVDEDVSERGVDLSAIFAEALRAMRARGDVQVSAGWGLSARAEGGVLTGEGLQDTRRTFWLTGQSAPGPRFDVLATVQGLDVLGSERALRAGVGAMPSDW